MAYRWLMTQGRTLPVSRSVRATWQLRLASWHCQWLNGLGSRAGQLQTCEPRQVSPAAEAGLPEIPGS